MATQFPVGRTTYVEKELTRARRQIFIIALLTSVAGGIVSYLVALYISSPVMKITEATRLVANGCLDARVNISRQDEIGALAGAFNKMTEDLRDTTVSKDYFDSIIKSMNDTLVVIGPDARIRSANKAACELLEYEACELVGKHIAIIIPQDDHNSPDAPDCEKVMTGSAVVNREIDYITRSGKRIPMDFSAAVLKDKNGKVEGAVCIARDITERKRAHEALRESERQLHHLYSQLVTAQEKERRRLSIELHDELGQSLMVLKLKVRSIRNSLGADQEELRKECDITNAYIKEITENVRRLSRDLSPSILEDLGLLAAIRWLVESFSEHSGIECSHDLTEAGSLFSKEEEITVYRIVQECLTNIAKHAQATQVTVTFGREDGFALFRVEDNGKGFDVEEAFHEDPVKRGLGVAALYERTRMLGGTMDVWSQKGAGTRITFTVPLGRREVP